MKTDKKIKDITGVILAGGKSSRMGRDKAMLRLDGATLFERIMAVMQSLFARVIIAGERPDLASSKVPCYPDLYPGSALGGLYTGLLKAKNDMIFVCACDMPFPDGVCARAILSQKQGHDVVVPRAGNNYYEPLFGVYRKTCLPYMLDMLECGEYRIYDFYPRVRASYVGVEQLPPGWEKALLNVNTPEEYKYAKENM